MLLRAALFVMLGILMLTVIGLVIASVLLAFLTIVSPPVATLLTAFCLAVVGLLLLLIIILSRRRYGAGMVNGLAVLVPNVLGFIKRRPLGAVGTALAVGVLAELLQSGGKSSNDRRA